MAARWQDLHELLAANAPTQLEVNHYGSGNVQIRLLREQAPGAMVWDELGKLTGPAAWAVNGMCTLIENEYPGVEIPF